MLKLHELTRRFGKLTALNHVSFEVKAGAIHGLIGPNGSGKTTLFNLVSGFLPPTSGRVIWEGRDVTGLPPYATSRLGITRTFQMTSNYPNLSVLDNLVIASRNRTASSRLSQILHLPAARAEEQRHREAARSILDRFGLLGFAETPAGDLPGGTQKVLGIAIALAASPRLLMLDEPLAGLNTGEKANLMGILKSLRADGHTILIIEHDMKAIMRACDRITVLCYGDLLAEGSPDEISRDPETIRAYLGDEVI